MRFRFAIGLGCAMLVCAMGADARTKAAVRKTIENSVLVTGSIDIGMDGTVTAHTIDQPEKLPKVVRDLVSKGASQFLFEPVAIDGKIVKARAKMSVRVIAQQLDDGNYRLRIGSASFGEEGGSKDEAVTAIDMLKPPMYPPGAYRSGVQGTVYLVLKVGRDGKVVDAIDEQVNLTVLGTEPQMRRARESLAKAAAAAGRKWRFQPPTKGSLALEEFWSVRVPVAFALCDSRSECESESNNKPAYGTWKAYVPGPKNNVPWISKDQNRQNPDAIAAGDVRPIGSGPKLLTPLGEG